MSRWMHCDNKSCDKTKNLDRPQIVHFGQPGWVAVEQDDKTLHFHDGACLARHLSFHLESEVTA